LGYADGKIDFQQFLPSEDEIAKIAELFKGETIGSSYGINWCNSCNQERTPNSIGYCDICGREVRLLTLAKAISKRIRSDI
ncbi:unnamed protein product, partial [marine sediment metagenome]